MHSLGVGFQCNPDNMYVNYLEFIGFEARNHHESYLFVALLIPLLTTESPHAAMLGRNLPVIVHSVTIRRLYFRGRTGYPAVPFAMPISPR